MANAFLPLEETNGNNGDSKDGEEENETAQNGEKQAKIQPMKDVKAQVQQTAERMAEQSAAYIMLSFDNMDNMMEFLDIFNLPEQTQIIKGEEFLSMLQND